MHVVWKSVALVVWKHENCLEALEKKGDAEMFFLMIFVFFFSPPLFHDSKVVKAFERKVHREKQCQPVFDVPK